MWLKNDVAKVRGFSETCNTKNLGFLHKKIPNVCETLGIFFVVQGGFEPPQTEPKPVVLPLHHWTPFAKCGCKGKKYLAHDQIISDLFILLSEDNSYSFPSVPAGTYRQSGLQL